MKNEHPLEVAIVAAWIAADALLSLLVAAAALVVLGTTALAEQRIQAFEAEIEQPLVREGPQAGPGRGRKTCYPDNGFSDPQAQRMRGTDTGYLMARLQRLDPATTASVEAPPAPIAATEHPLTLVAGAAMAQLEPLTVTALRRLARAAGLPRSLTRSGRRDALLNALVGLEVAAMI